MKPATAETAKIMDDVDDDEEEYQPKEETKVTNDEDVYEPGKINLNQEERVNPFLANQEKK